MPKSYTYNLPAWLPENIRQLYVRLSERHSDYDKDFIDVLKNLTLNDDCKAIWKSSSPSGGIPDNIQITFLAMVDANYRLASISSRELHGSREERTKRYEDINKYAKKLVLLLNNTYVNSENSVNTVDSNFIYLNQRKENWLDNFNSYSPVDMLDQIISYSATLPFEVGFKSRSASKDFIRNLTREYMHRFPQNRIPRSSIALITKKLFSEAITITDVANIIRGLKKAKNKVR